MEEEDKYTIKLNTQSDLQNDMFCKVCDNPISADGNYYCFRCKHQNYFELVKKDK